MEFVYYQVKIEPSCDGDNGCMENAHLGKDDGKDDPVQSSTDEQSILDFPGSVAIKTEPSWSTDDDSSINDESTENEFNLGHQAGNILQVKGEDWCNTDAGHVNALQQDLETSYHQRPHPVDTEPICEDDGWIDTDDIAVSSCSRAEVSRDQDRSTQTDRPGEEAEWDSFLVNENTDTFASSKGTMHSLKERMRKRAVYQCDVCRKVFTRRSNLKVHLMSHTGDYPHKCDVCNKGYTRTLLLREHIMTCHTGYPYKCDMCEMRFLKLNELRKHIKAHEDFPFSCDICKKKFKGKQSFEKHMKNHKDEDYEICPKKEKEECAVSGSSIHSSESSQNRDVPIMEFSCESDWVSGNPNDAEDPMMAPSLKCDICEKVFSRRSNLNVHTMIHTGDYPYKCDICGKGFPLKYRLLRHLVVHTGHRPYKCQTCNKCFSMKGNLKAHMISHTGNYPLWKCDVCLKEFTRKSSLQVHLITHTGNFPYECDTCMKGFSRFSEWNKHKTSHTSDYPYKCDICEKGFPLKYKLRRHLVVHTGHSLYKCDTCNKDFNKKSNLKVHMMSHTGNYPLKCDVCEKGFAAKSKLKSHMKCHMIESSI